MRLLVGRIGRAHGILGEATIEVRTDNPEARFAIGNELDSDEHTKLTVTSSRVHNGILLLGFAGYSDRSSIEKLRNTLLYAQVDIDNEYEGDDYHVLQLIGCSAFSVSDNFLGTVIDVLNLPGQDLLVIKNETREVLIPFVHQLVPTVDIKIKRITVISPQLDGPTL